MNLFLGWDRKEALVTVSINRDMASGTFTELQYFSVVDVFILIKAEHPDRMHRLYLLFAFARCRTEVCCRILADDFLATDNEHTVACSLVQLTA